MTDLTLKQRKTLEELADYSGNLGKVMYGAVDKALIDAGLVLVRKRTNGRNKYPSFYYRLSATGRVIADTSN